MGNNVTTMQCYSKQSNKIVQDPRYLPCGTAPSGGAASCCVSGDTCLSNGVCTFSGAMLPDLSGYYLGGCTDPNYADSSCHSQCSKWPLQDIIWSEDKSNSTWSCCGFNSKTNKVTCGSPQGPLINDLPNHALLVATASVNSALSSPVPLGPATSTTTTSTSTSLASLAYTSSIPISITTSTSIGTSVIGATQATALKAHTQSTSDESLAATAPSLQTTQSLSSSDVTAIILGVLLLLSWAGFGAVLFVMKRKGRKGRTEREYSPEPASTRPVSATPIFAQPAMMAMVERPAVSPASQCRDVDSELDAGPGAGELLGDHPYTERYSFG